MAERSSLKPTAISAPTLTPQGQLAGKPAMPLSRPFTLVGSRNRAHLHLISSAISRNHCCIIVTDNGLYIRDLGSRSGIVVNGRKLKESDLRDGDVIQIGSFKFRFSDPAGPVRFPLTPKAAAATLHFGDNTHTGIDSRSLIIGRRANCDITLDNDAVSNTHAIIFEVNGERFIRDLGSRTGTLVNGRPIHHQLLNFGDVVQIGGNEIRYDASLHEDEIAEAVPSSDGIGPELAPIELEPDVADPEPIALDISENEPSSVASLELAPLELEPTEHTPATEAPEPISHTIPLDKDAGDMESEQAAAASSEYSSVENLAPPGALQQDETLPLAPDGYAAVEAGPSRLEESSIASEDAIALAPETATSEIPAVASAGSMPEATDARSESRHSTAMTPTDSVIGPESPTEPPDTHSTTEVDRVELEHDKSAEESSIPLEDVFKPVAAPSILTTRDEIEPAEGLDATSYGDRAERPVDPKTQAVGESPEQIEPAAESAPFGADSSADDNAPPTLDIAPTPFEEIPVSDTDAIAPLVDEPISETKSERELARDDSAWTLSVVNEELPSNRPLIQSTDEEVTSATEVDEPQSALPPTTVATGDESVMTADMAALPGEIGPAEQITLEHPVRPELPPDPSAIALSIESAAGPVLLPADELGTAAAAAGTAVGAASSSAIAPLKKARGRSKAAPKPAPSPRGRKKKTPTQPGTADDSTIQSLAEVAPTETPPAPAPRKRGGPRKKNQAPVPQVDETDTGAAGIPISAESTADTAESLTTSPVAGGVADSAGIAELAALNNLPHAAEPGVNDAELEPVKFDLESTAAGVGSRADSVVSDAPILRDAESAQSPIELDSATDLTEILEPTEPTPESAQVLEPELIPLEFNAKLDESVDETLAGLSLTDTAFGREVVDLTGTDSPSLVEAHDEIESVGAGPVQESRSDDTSATLTDGQEVTPVSDETVDVASTTDDAIATAAPDVLNEAPENTGQPARLAEPVTTDEKSDIAAPSIDVGTPVDRVDETPRVDEPIEPVGSVEVIPLEDNAKLSDQSVYEADPQKPNPESRGDDFDLPDLDLDIDLVDEGESVNFPDEPADTSEAHSDAAPAAKNPELEPLQTVTNESVIESSAAPHSAPNGPASAVDPFFGMNRDLASFLGGVPLTLTAATPVAPAATSMASVPIAPVTPPVKPDQPPPGIPDPDDVPEIDFSGTEEGLDLFEDAPDKLDQMPDTLAPISDVTSVLSSPPPTAPLTPAPSPTAPAPASLPQPTRMAPDAPSAGMRAVAPPPPPRTSPLRSVTSNVSFAPPPHVPRPEAPVSFGGAPGAGGLTAPFGAVAPAPQGGRAVDVFSHTAFPPLDPSVFSAPKRPSSPRTVTPGAAAHRDADTAATDPGEVLPIEAETLPDLTPAPPRRAAIPPNQQLAAGRPTPTAMPAKRPWWKSLKVLLPLVLLAIIVVIVVVMFFPPKHTVQGTLEIKGLDKDNQQARRAQVAQFRKLIQDPQVQQNAIANLNLRHIAPGFVAEPLAMAALADPINSPFNDTPRDDHHEMVINRATTDVKGDSVRMNAVLSAVYEASRSLTEKAQALKSHQSQAIADAQEQEKQRQAEETTIQGIRNQLEASAGAAAGPWLASPQSAVAQVQMDDVAAQQAALQAAADVESKRQALRRAQSAAGPADAGVANESRRLKNAINDLEVRLQAIRLAQAGRAEDSLKKFETSLDAFDKQLSESAAAANSGSVDGAAKLVADIRQLDANLADRNREDTKTVSQLRRQIVDQREAHLRHIWSGDPTLQAMVEDRDAQSHRYGAAIDSNYADEAVKIKGVLEDLDKKIEARRNELATGSQYTDPLQTTLQQAFDQTEAARKNGEAQMNQKLQSLLGIFSNDALATALPTSGKLSQAASDLLVARQAYATAASLSGTGAEAEARRLQLQIADQQARLDSLKQDQSRAGPVETARHDLEKSEAAEAKAMAAYTSSHNNLALLRQLIDQTSKRDSTVQALQLSQKDVDDSKPTPELLKPDESAITPIYARDQRFIYLIAGLGGVLLVFAPLVLLTVISDSSHNDGELRARPLMFEPLEDPTVYPSIDSDADSLFAEDPAHA